MWDAIAWTNLEDLLLDMGAVIFVMTVVLVLAVRTNRADAGRMPAPDPGPQPPAPRPGPEPAPPRPGPPLPAPPDSPPGGPA